MARFAGAMQAVCSKQMLGKVTPLEQCFFIGFGALLFAIPYFFYDRKGTFLEVKRIGLSYTGAVLSCFVYIFYFVAVTFIPIVDLLLFMSASAIFVPFIAMFWLKEKISVGIWCSIGLGFLGVWMMIGTEKGGINKGDILALVVAILVAVIYVLIQKMAKFQTTRQYLFYYGVFMSLVCLPVMIIGFSSQIVESWPYLLGLGSASFFNQISFIYAMRYVSSVEIAPFNYLNVFFGGIAGWLLYNNIPNYSTIVGGMCIVLSGILMVFVIRQRESSQKRIGD